MKRSDVFRKICTDYFGMPEAETENWVKRLFKNPPEKEDNTMPKCPWCGSTAQVKEIETEYLEDGWSIEVVRTYKCGCGQMFTGTSYHTCQECYEIVEKIENRG